MRFSVNSGDLAGALGWVGRALAARPPVAVLNGVKITVTDERLHLAAFDYEQSALSALSLASGSEPGEVVVPGRLLTDIVRALPKGDADVVLDGGRVRLSAGSAKFSLPTLVADDYPELPVLPPMLATVDAHEFAAAVKQTTVAASGDTTLQAFSAVSMTFQPTGQIELAATDRYRLTVRRFAFEGQVEEPVTLLVPSKILDGYAKALAGDGQVNLRSAQDGSNVFGISGTTQAGTTRLIDADYPKYQRLLPESFAAEAVVDTAALIEVVKRVKLVAELNAVRLSFERDVLTVSSGREDTGASETLPITFDGAPMGIAFNHDYLLDGLGAVGTDTATIRLNASTKPAVINPVGDDEKAFTYLLMPVRLNG